MISETLLLSFGAEYKFYAHDDYIFTEQEYPQYFYWITEGKVKLNNYIEDGKEFIHFILGEWKCLGLSYIFAENRYLTNAVAVQETKILRLSKAAFFELLNSNKNLYLFLAQELSDYMHYQFLMMQTISIQNPEKKLKIFLDYLKENQCNSERYSMQVPFTRQQLGFITGLSVETVIRTIKNMEKSGFLKICNRKIFY